LPYVIRRAQPPFDVQYHHDPKCKFKFKPETPDDEWLAKVGAEGWIVLSHDRKWHDESPCIAAIKQHQIGCFYLWGANVNTWLKMSLFMRSCGKMINAIHNAPRPFIYHVGISSALRRVEIPPDSGSSQATGPQQGVGPSKTIL
jgi:hypothetical protein